MIGLQLSIFDIVRTGSIEVLSRANGQVVINLMFKVQNHLLLVLAIVVT